MLRAEGHLEKAPCYGKHVPRGELVELLSKALLYSEVEAHWRGNALTKNCKSRFSLLDKHVCSLDPAISPVTIIQPLPTLDIPPVSLNGKRKAATPGPEDGVGPKEKRARTEEMDVDSVASVERKQLLTLPVHCLTSPRPSDRKPHLCERLAPTTSQGTRQESDERGEQGNWHAERSSV